MQHRISEYMRILSLITDEAEGIQRQYDNEIDAVAKKYAASINTLKEKAAGIEKEMLKAAHQARKEIFGASDIYATEYGQLLREIAEKVTIPRDAITKCEEYGFNEVVVISKALDRAAVEKWPDEKLFLLGAKKRIIEKIVYERRRDVGRDKK
ncbi:MAG: host-nuclease inhibitor Gam family protein [Burkholderiales bacterium]|nr:host-nuclease inhibitor Gam family protein [Burkholderiales bacterium]